MEKMKKMNINKLTWLDQAASYHRAEAERFASARQETLAVQSLRTAQWYTERARISRYIERIVPKGTFTSL